MLYDLPYIESSPQFLIWSSMSKVIFPGVYSLAPLNQIHNEDDDISIIIHSHIYFAFSSRYVFHNGVK